MSKPLGNRWKSKPHHSFPESMSCFRQGPQKNPDSWKSRVKLPPGKRFGNPFIVCLRAASKPIFEWDIVQQQILAGKIHYRRNIVVRRLGLHPYCQITAAICKMAKAP
jgi:hypothetical protein